MDRKLLTVWITHKKMIAFKRNRRATTSECFDLQPVLWTSGYRIWTNNDFQLAKV